MCYIYTWGHNFIRCKYSQSGKLFSSRLLLSCLKHYIRSVKESFHFTENINILGLYILWSIYSKKFGIELAISEFNFFYIVTEKIWLLKSLTIHCSLVPGMAEGLAYSLFCPRGHGFKSRWSPLSGVVRGPLYQSFFGFKYSKWSSLNLPPKVFRLLSLTKIGCFFKWVIILNWKVKSFDLR